MNNRQMSVILDGNFATGKGNKGNFNAYPAEGERFFIHKRLMDRLGFAKDPKVGTVDKDLEGKFPMYAIIGEKEITPNDENGNPLEPVIRTQALSVFATKDAMIEAFTSSRSLAIEADAHIDKVKITSKLATAVYATEAGLSEEAVKALLELA